MTLFFSENQVESLLDMKEVVGAVDEVFRRQGLGEAVNSMRTRSHSGRSTLNVMHASLPYLGRAGLKSYMSTPGGTKFLVVLFDIDEATPLAIMGADILGRYRTGAASAVATRHLFRQSSARLAVFGSGRQAMTQVLAMRTVLSLEEVKVWSPNRSHREDFASGLTTMGVKSIPAASPREASTGADVGSTITSAVSPFLGAEDVAPLAHLNVCGGNHPKHSELTAEAVGSFATVAVDDLSQAKVEYGDLIGAESAGEFAWDKAMELGAIVAGKASPKGRTLFKSGGAAMEDVAVASLIYDKALKAGRTEGSEFDFR